MCNSMTSPSLPTEMRATLPRALSGQSDVPGQSGRQRPMDKARHAMTLCCSAMTVHLSAICREGHMCKTQLHALQSAVLLDSRCPAARIRSKTVSDHFIHVELVLNRYSGTAHSEPPWLRAILCLIYIPLSISRRFCSQLQRVCHPDLH